MNFKCYILENCMKKRNIKRKNNVKHINKNINELVYTITINKDLNNNK